MQKGAVWIIDSDIEDHDIVQEAWNELGLTNDLIFLPTAELTLTRLLDVREAPFIIICGLNLSGITGFELRQRMLDAGSKLFRTVPFIFWSTEASETQITRAFDLSVHGFFIKENSMEEVKKTFTIIINYWFKSRMPSKIR